MGFLQTKKQKAQTKTPLLLPTGEQQQVKGIEPNVVAALCSLREKIHPLVPKSTFGSLKTFQEMTKTAKSQNVFYHGHSIRGYSHMAYSPAYQNYGVNCGHCGQHPK